MESPNKAQRQGNPVSKNLSFIGKFIDKYFLRQQVWVQSFTFVIFVLLFAYGFILLPGKIVLDGNLWVRQDPSSCALPPCRGYARYYVLRWGTTDFISDAKGQYKIVLSPLEYLRLFSSGSHGVAVSKVQLASDKQQKPLNRESGSEHDQLSVGDQQLELNRIEGQFKDVIFPIPSDAQPSFSLSPQRPDDMSLVPSAWGDEPQGRYRLIIRSIRMTGGPAKADVSLALFSNSQTIELRVGQGGQELLAGRIPVVSNQSVDLGSAYYFPIPGMGPPPVTGMVRVTWPGSIFGVFSSTEDFNLPPRQIVGQSFQISGTKGSLLAAQVVDTDCVTPPRIFERTYLQVPGPRFKSDVFIYVGHMYRRKPRQYTGSLYVIIGQQGLKRPDTPGQSVALEPEEFEKLPLKGTYRLNFYNAGEHLQFDYEGSRYLLSIRTIDQPWGKDDQNVLVDICPEQSDH